MSKKGQKSKRRMTRWRARRLLTKGCAAMIERFCEQAVPAIEAGIEDRELLFEDIRRELAGEENE